MDFGYYFSGFLAVFYPTLFVIGVCCIIARIYMMAKGTDYDD